MSAHAQSSVTLYGSLDAGIVYANNVNGHSVWLQNSGSVSSTYFGLRGAEDLGNGLKAIFTLENGFDINNGRYHGGDAGFNRKAYVGLKSNTGGTLTLGRQYDSVVDYLSPLSAAGTGYGNNLAGHPFDNDNLAQGSPSRTPSNTKVSTMPASSSAACTASAIIRAASRQAARGAPARRIAPARSISRVPIFN